MKKKKVLPPELIVLNNIETIKRCIYGKNYKGCKRPSPSWDEFSKSLDGLLRWVVLNHPSIDTGPLHEYRRSEIYLVQTLASRNTNGYLADAVLNQIKRDILEKLP